MGKRRERKIKYEEIYCGAALKIYMFLEAAQLADGTTTAAAYRGRIQTIVQHFASRNEQKAFQKAKTPLKNNNLH